MITGAFAYHRPTTINEAVGLLSSLGEDARPLAGGHSLIPLMKLRLAAPSDLIDLGAIPDLKGIRADGNDIVASTDYGMFWSRSVRGERRDLGAHRRMLRALSRIWRRGHRFRAVRRRRRRNDALGGRRGRVPSIPSRLEPADRTPRRHPV